MGIQFSSCASDEALMEETVPIRMAVKCQPQTRGPSGADSQGSSFDEGAKINVYIVQSDNTVLSNNQTYTANAPSDGKNILTPPDATRPPYYSNGGKTVDIKACYPKTVLNNTTTFTVQLDQTTQSANEHVDTYKLSDLMTASVTGQGKTHEDIVLQFRHHMAKIKVNATATDELTIQSINLANVQTTATYNNTTDKWEGSGATGTITLAKDGTAAILGGVALFPAQTIVGKTFIQVVTNKGTANFVVISKDFQEGYEYTANLEVGMQNLKLTAAITDWNAATGSVTVTKVNKYGMYIDNIGGEYIYDGTAKKPTISVHNKKSDTETEDLILNRDYTVDYYNNVNVGSALAVAVGIEGTQYSGSAAVQSFVIGQAESSMAFSNPGPITIEYMLNGTYSNLLTNESKYDGRITWTSTNTAAAMVDGNGLVSIVAPGTTTIKVSSDGSGNYTAISEQYTLTVSKRSTQNHLSITALGGYETVYDGKEKRPVPVVYDGGEGGKRWYDQDGVYTISYSNNINAGVNTATVTITGIGVYDGTSVSRTFSIDKAPAVITMDTTPKTMGIGETYTCGATSNYGNVTYASSDPTVASVVSTTGEVTGLKAGTATITASVASGDNYTAATNVQLSVTVQKQETSYTAPGHHEYTCPATATYTFELVGGAGGTYQSAAGGYGGIAKASARLEAGTVVHVYVGGGGGYGQSTTGGLNGSTDGGYGGRSGTDGGGSGGAASEIRIGGTALSNRKMVAGGGGGASGWRREGKNGGSSSAGNNWVTPYGTDATSYGGGGGGGYYGGKKGNRFGGGYGGSNYIDSSWTAITNGVSTNGPRNGNDTNTYNGYVIITYQYD